MRLFKKSPMQAACASCASVRARHLSNTHTLFLSPTPPAPHFIPALNQCPSGAENPTPHPSFFTGPLLSRPFPVFRSPAAPPSLLFWCKHALSAWGLKCEHVSLLWKPSSLSAVGKMHSLKASWGLILSSPTFWDKKQDLEGSSQNCRRSSAKKCRLESAAQLPFNPHHSNVLKPSTRNIMSCSQISFSERLNRFECRESCDLNWSQVCAGFNWLNTRADGGLWSFDLIADVFQEQPCWKVFAK